MTAVVDARRGEVFAQRFVLGGPRPVPDGEPVVVSPEALAGRLADGDVLVGDGAERHAEMLRGAGARIVGLILPAPGVAGRLAASGALEAVDPVGVLPLYLRDPDAVANFTVASQLSR